MQAEHYNLVPIQLWSASFNLTPGFVARDCGAMAAAGGAFGGNRGMQPLAPEKGVFPLDHLQECKHVSLKFVFLFHGRSVCVGSCETASDFATTNASSHLSIYTTQPNLWVVGIGLALQAFRKHLPECIELNLQLQEKTMHALTMVWETLILSVKQGQQICHVKCLCWLRDRYASLLKPSLCCGEHTSSLTERTSGLIEWIPGLFP